MTQHRFANSGRLVNEEWHRERQQARETAMNADEFGPIETERFDLDTAGITGEENDRTYELDPYGPPGREDRRDDPRFG